VSRPSPRVILIGLDGFPFAAISPERTPNLLALAAAGAMAPDGARCELPSTTYPGFGSLLTGLLPEHHGVRTTSVASPGTGAWARVRTVQGRTLFDACRAAGLRSAAIQGDHKLHSVLATERAAEIWPPRGVPAAGAVLDAHGYLVNAEVAPHALAAVGDRDLPFVFVHLNETDTLGHELGPRAEATVAAAAATDTLLGELLDAARRDWERLLVVVASDHDMEPRTTTPLLRLDGVEFRKLIGAVVPDGGAAVVQPVDGIRIQELAEEIGSVTGVAAVTPAGGGLAVVAARPGWAFEGASPGGFHGGPATARTIAVAGGGHPVVAAIARSLQDRQGHITDWAPTIANALGIDLGPVDGVDLAAEPGHRN
jgi:arylsulfatase A-like enzyme